MTASFLVVGDQAAQNPVGRPEVEQNQRLSETAICGWRCCRTASISFHNPRSKSPRKASAIGMSRWRAILSKPCDYPKNDAFTSGARCGEPDTAAGNRRDSFVAVDPAGGHHSPNKKLTGLTLAEIRQRLGDLDRTQLPSVDQAQR